MKKSSSPKLIKNTAILLLAVTVIGANAFLLSPVLQTVGESVGANAQMTAWAVSAYGGATAVSGLYLTALLQPYGYRVTLFVSGMLLTLGVAITGIAFSLWLLILGQIIAGLGAGVMLPTAYAAASIVAPQSKESRVIGWVTAGWSISLIAAVPASTLIANFLSWRYAYLVITILSAASVLGVTTLPKQQKHKQKTRTTVAEALGVELAMPTLIMVFLYMSAFYGVYTFLGDFTQRSLDQTTIGSGIVVLGYGLGFGAGSTIGSMIDRFSPAYVVGPLLGLLSLTYAIGIPASGSLVVLAIWCVVWGFWNQLGLNSLVTLLSGLSSKHKIRLLGLYSVAAYGGAMVAGLVFGAAYHATGFEVLLGLASVLCLTGAAVAIHVSRGQYRSSRSSQ